MGTAFEQLLYAIIVDLQPIDPSPDYSEGALRFNLDLLGCPSLVLGRTHRLSLFLCMSYHSTRPIPTYTDSASRHPPIIVLHYCAIDLSLTMAPSISIESHENLVAKTYHSLRERKDSLIQPEIDIIDIRHDAVELNLKDEIHKSLRPQSGLKQLPTLLLYSERGLQLFEEV